MCSIGVATWIDNQLTLVYLQYRIPILCVYLRTMSISDLCQQYLSATSIGNWDNWKRSLSNIAKELEIKSHPDFKSFHDASCTLMMNDKPGYWNWLNQSIEKLIQEQTSRLDPLPVLPDYDELSSHELVVKYESNDGNYSKQDILNELKQRYPMLIELNDEKSEVNLRESLKSVL